MKIILCCVLLLTAVWSAGAHEVRPAFLQLTERAPGDFDVLWKVPAPGGVPLTGEEIPHEQPKATPGGLLGRLPVMPCGCPAPTEAQLARGRALPIHPALPGGVTVLAPMRVERLEGAEIRRWSVRTGPQGLEGGEIGVHGLAASMVDVLVHVAFADGRSVSRLLRPESPSFVLHAADAGPLAAGYFTLGVEHILFGIDHLLFVLCLLLLVRGWRAILQTVTAFTVAHSITLGLAAVGWVNLPSAPVEAVIALSIVFLATEIAKRRAGTPGFTERRPWLVAFAFGLLHGFGFAGALSEIGLPANDIPLALLLFNLGVEAGQLVFVAAVLVLAAGARRLIVTPPAWVRAAPAYGVGSVASFWLISRVAALW